MSESKRVSIGSVAAFMWLPQFHLSLRGFAHIVPVFVRTVAMAFVAAGLIPNNHPATRYGVEGVRRYTFSELVAEAWFNLRSTNASVHQWALFTSVIMMAVAVVSALGAFVLTIFFNLGAVAHAQIFSYPEDINGVEAYTGQGDQTDLDAMQAGMPSAAGTTMFDMRTDPGEASQDYALMVLDKVLRQSAVGTGGAMQNGLASMMEIYNTGIMVVAAVMIFWMILSIVVDTAKSGIVGGGRHNMVWTPIRVVFALGIMIPLGTTGFSSGQFAVMKLAEWGSNFGSRLWAVYVQGVVDNAQLLTEHTPARVGHVVTGLAKTMTCQVAYNASVRQVMGWAQRWFTDGPLVQAYPSYDGGKQATTYYYTNDSDGNLCGAVTFAGGGSLLTSFSVAANMSLNQQISFAVTALNGNPLTGGSLALQLLQYQEQFEAVSELVDEDGNVEPDSGGSVIMDMRRLACQIAATAFTEDSVGINAADGINPCDTLGTSACGDNGSGLPDSSCVESAVTTLSAALAAADAAGRPALENWINNELEPQMSARGWAGMGTWFMYIQAINELIISAQNAAISVQPGKLWANVMQPGLLGQAGRGAMQYGTVVGLTGAVNFSTTPEANQKTFIAMQRFDSWWDGMVQDASVSGNDALRAMTGELKSPGKALDDDGDGFLSAIKDMATDPWAAVEYVFSYMFPGDIMIFSIDTTANQYPLSQLVKMGSTIQNIGLTIIVVNSVLALIPTVNYGSSTLSNLLGVIGKGLFLGGVMLGVYLPILPLLRVALAVLTWITSVFEAVIMVPIAALAHLSSEGEGLAGGARTAWILWLNVLLRPALVVCGFVGAMLIFNAFAVYFHVSFMHGVELARAQMGVARWMVSIFTYSIVYVVTLYTAANTTFKLLDLIPNAMMRWIGGTPDQSFDSDNDGYAFAATQMITNTGGSPTGNFAGQATNADGSRMLDASGKRMGMMSGWRRGFSEWKNGKPGS